MTGCDFCANPGRYGDCYRCGLVGCADCVTPPVTIMTTARVRRRVRLCDECLVSEPDGLVLVALRGYHRAGYDAVDRDFAAAAISGTGPYYPPELAVTTTPHPMHDGRTLVAVGGRTVGDYTVLDRGGVSWRCHESGVQGRTDTPAAARDAVCAPRNRFPVRRPRPDRYIVGRSR